MHCSFWHMYLRKIKPYRLQTQSNIQATKPN